MKLFLHILLGILLIGKKPAAAQQTEEINRLLEEFENKLNQDLMNDHSGAGFSYAIVEHQQVLHANAIGYADYSQRIKADTSSLYRIGSLTKCFTALLMIVLVQDSIIQLNEPIEKYLPEIKQLQGYSAENKITFQQLASHTSGLEREPKTKSASSGAFEKWEDKLMSSIPKTRIIHSPGKKFLYSNIGYGILGLSLSRAAGVPYTKLVEQRIFKPLKMNNSCFHIDNKNNSTLAQGMKPHAGKISQKALKEHQGRGYKVPNGGIYSTSMDLLKFIQCIAGYSDIVEPRLLSLMKEAQTEGGEYGFGLFRYKEGALSVICHDGLVDGYSSVFVLDQPTGIGIVILRNCSKGKTNLYNAAFGLLRKIIELKKKN